MTKYTFHSFLAGIALLLLSACGPEGTSFRIKGSFRDMQAGELYIYNLSDDYARLDTLTIQEGKFLYRGEADEVTSYGQRFEKLCGQWQRGEPADESVSARNLHSKPY